MNQNSWGRTQNRTIDYYNHHAKEFVSTTISVDFKTTQDKFIRHLPGKEILDFGCGSGRDAKYFLEAGFQVTATDGSEEMCRCASEYVGIPIRKMLFQELNVQDQYDGIWACSSILHLPKKELENVLCKMVEALHVGGITYTSFKYGNFEGERNGRYFTDFTIESFRDFIRKIDGVVLEEYWISDDVGPGRGEEKWLNLILRKR